MVWSAGRGAVVRAVRRALMVETQLARAWRAASAGAHQRRVLGRTNASMSGELRRAIVAQATSRPPRSPSRHQRASRSRQRRLRALAGPALPRLPGSAYPRVEGWSDHRIALATNRRKGRVAQLAGEARDRDRLARKFCDTHHLGNQPIKDLFELAHIMVGIDVLSMDADEAEHGQTMLDPTTGRIAIAVATTPDAMRQRSTVAHELGHVLAGDLDLDEPLIPGADTAEEVRANTFARHASPSSFRRPVTRTFSARPRSPGAYREHPLPRGGLGGAERASRTGHSTAGFQAAGGVRTPCGG